MKDNAVSRAIDSLEAWKEKKGAKAAYSFAIDTSGLSRYKLSLYHYGEYSEIVSAFSISTNNIDEIIQKLAKGIMENEND